MLSENDVLILEYLEISRNRQRRHARLGYLTPVEYERVHHDTKIA